jgi:kumamolisin
MKSRSRQPISGTEKTLPPEAELVGEADPEQRIEITLLVRRRPSSTAARDAHAKAALKMGTQLPEKRRYLSHEEFAAKHGASPEDLAKIDAFASEHKLTVVHTNIPARTVKLSGTIADLAAAFQTRMKKYKMGSRVFRGRTGPVSIPKELADVVVGVFGLDARPFTSPPPPLTPIKPKRPTKKKITLPGAAQTSIFTVPQVAQLYNFPAKLDGSGESIAIIEFNDVDQNGKPTGGGFQNSDLQQYFQGLNLPMPQIAVVGVDGGALMPGPAPSFDQEITLDIEVAGSSAPGASLVVYMTPNTSQGFIDAVHTAVHDTVRKPSIISISWGSPEDAPYTGEQLLTALNDALIDAAHLGITVCCATGDIGSSDLVPPDGEPHVDFPGSSPFALACGGTRLAAEGDVIASEVVWNDGNMGGSGGGGVSNLFPVPAYQSEITVPQSPTGKAGRGVPDVAGHAATFRSGYEIILNGKKTTMGGTSAVAPLWAGLIARINQRLTSLGKPRAGFINPILYQSADCFHDIIQGNNDIVGSFNKYSAGPGWDPCTGLGTPIGIKIMQALGG